MRHSIPGLCGSKCRSSKCRERCSLFAWEVLVLCSPLRGRAFDWPSFNFWSREVHVGSLETELERQISQGAARDGRLLLYCGYRLAIRTTKCGIAHNVGNANLGCLFNPTYIEPTEWSERLLACCEKTWLLSYPPRLDVSWPDEAKVGEMQVADLLLEFSGRTKATCQCCPHSWYTDSPDCNMLSWYVKVETAKASDCKLEWQSPSVALSVALLLQFCFYQASSTATILSFQGRCRALGSQ